MGLDLHRTIVNAKRNRRPGTRISWRMLRHVHVLVSFIALTGLVLYADVPVGVEAQPQKLKVHISVDMEGVGGVVTGEQLGPSGFEYGRFREFMTREALAAVEAAKAVGATDII